MTTPNKNIVLFNSTIAWGGGEKWHFDVAKSLSEAGWTVTVFCHKKSELRLRLKQARVNLQAVSISNLSFVNPIKIRKLCMLLKQTGASTILMNLSADVKAAGIAAKRAGFNNIIYRRGSAIPIKNTWLNRYLFAKIITNILANSEATKATINEKNPKLFNPDKIQVIYNGLRINEFIDNKNAPIYQRENNELIIGNAGRLVEQKNQKALIQLASLLKSNNVDFKMLIAGDGPMRKELEQQCKELQVEEQVVFLGFQKDIRPFLQSIDIFVLTSFWEGFGYVLAEAMLYKKPLIGFDLSSNPELIQHKLNGFLIDPNNTKALAESIEALNANRAAIDVMGAAGFKIANEKFDFNKNLKLVESWLLTLT